VGAAKARFSIAIRDSRIRQPGSKQRQLRRDAEAVRIIGKITSTALPLAGRVSDGSHRL